MSDAHDRSLARSVAAGEDPGPLVRSLERVEAWGDLLRLPRTLTTRSQRIAWRLRAGLLTAERARVAEAMPSRDVDFGGAAYVVARELLPPGEWLAVARVMVSRACDHAERVLPVFESAHPDDGRPRAAIAAARAWVRGGDSADRAPVDLAAAEAVDAAVDAATAVDVATDRGRGYVLPTETSVYAHAAAAAAANATLAIDAVLARTNAAGYVANAATYAVRAVAGSERASAEALAAEWLWQHETIADALAGDL